MSEETKMVPYSDKVARVRTLLERSKGQIAAALPAHLKPERMLRVAMTAVQQTPALLDCDQLSLLGAVVQASQLGLEVGVLGQAWLVPFKGRVQLIIGYRGLISLARRSGEIVSIDAHVVHERDVFRLSYGSEGKLIHEPCLDGEPGAVRGAYAYARLKEGGYAYDWMSLAEISKVRASSQAAQAGPWVTWTEEMQRKTVAKRLCKWLPLSVELSEALELDSRAEAGLPLPDGVIDIPKPEPQKALPALTQVLQEQAPATEVGDCTVKGFEAGHIPEETPPAESTPAPAPQKVRPSECSHNACPPSRVSGLAAGTAIVCPDCGQEFRSTRAAGGKQSRLPQE